MVNKTQEHCTCANRALARNERVEYIVPHADGLKGYVFAKDCPVHGYSHNSASEEDEND